MKTIRYAAAFLLILTGILHVSVALLNLADPTAIPLLVFGIIYFIVGVLLLLNIKFVKYLALIFPVIGGTAAIIGIKNWTAMITFLFAIDVVVVVCCLLLIIKRADSKSSRQSFGESVRLHPQSPAFGTGAASGSPPRVGSSLEILGNLCCRVQCSGKKIKLFVCHLEALPNSGFPPARE